MHRSQPRALAGALLILTLTLAACGDGGSSTPAEADGGETVSLSGSQFTPSSLTVPVGTTVTFTDTSGHTVTEGTNGVAVDDPIVDEGGGSDITVTFDEAGTYNITCTVHASMNMTITVEG